MENINSIEKRINELLAQMTLQEKVGQMTMVEKESIQPEQVKEYFIGSVLSGGGGNPTPNNPSSWRKMVNNFQEPALKTRLKIPLIYAVDAVHGHNNVKDAVIFPHNIGLGATGDADLVERIGQVTASELLATSVHWTFAPAVSVPRDIRWGRTYEGYSENSELVSELGDALVKGLQGDLSQSEKTRVMACAKHYIADGATEWGSRKLAEWTLHQGSNASPQIEAFAQQLDNSQGKWQIDQGIAMIDEAELRSTHLPPYQSAIEAGVLSIMVSYSSWDGLKMHAHRYLLTDVLKGELGFQGLLVTDWMAIDQIDADYYTCAVTSINAGLDMIMVPYDYQKFISTVIQAVQNDDIDQNRIDDAVRRILRAKLALGLFEDPYGDEALLESVGSDKHRELARDAVQKSAVLLKNNDVLPLKPKTSLLVTGQAADDIGLACGGWTIEWQGSAGAITTGTTLLEGLNQNSQTEVTYQTDGNIQTHAPVGIVVISEQPYAEGDGDRADLSITEEQKRLIKQTRQHCDQLILIIYSGRPLVIADVVDDCDTIVSAWLPGSEASALADVLYGKVPFTGKLPFGWLGDPSQVPQAQFDSIDAGWAYGHGLTT